MIENVKFVDHAHVCICIENETDSLIEERAGRLTQPLTPSHFNTLFLQSRMRRYMTTNKIFSNVVDFPEF